MGRGRRYPIPNGYRDEIINFNSSGIGYRYGDMLGESGSGIGEIILVPALLHCHVHSPLPLPMRCCCAFAVWSQKFFSPSLISCVDIIQFKLYSQSSVKANMTNYYHTIIETISWKILDSIVNCS